MAVSYLPPGISTTTSSASNVGGNNQAGLVAAVVGSFPKGPAWPPVTLPGSNFPTPYPVPSPASYLASSKSQALGTWGDDFTSNDLAGWTGPGYVRLLYEAAEGANTPQVLMIRTGITQASATVPNASGAVVWTATALLTLGGTQGNGITVQYGGTTLTITSTTAAIAAGYLSETWTVPASATWAQIATVVNGNSRLIFLNSASADTAATAGTTLATLSSGADGASPTLSQINAGLDALLNVPYDLQPIHLLCPAYADTGTGGAIKHALTNAIAMLANGQRPRVIGGIAPTVGGTGNLTTILAMGADLVPSENAGDSGRCVLWANNQPVRIDPATNNPRTYPGWAPAAAHVGLEASSPVQQAFGRFTLPGFVYFAENYTVAERTGQSGLLANGIMVCKPTGRMIDQVTTAISTSFRRDDNIDRAENWWVADYQNFLDLAAIEIAAGPSAGVTIYDLADSRLRTYAEQGIIASYQITVQQSSGDARQWTVSTRYGPIFVVRRIVNNVQLAAPPLLPIPTITVSTGA